MNRRLTMTLLAALLGTAPHVAAEVDLNTLDRDAAGGRAQVLVLGSVHLAQEEHALSDDALAPLLDRLQAFAPDVIAVESVSGEQCDAMARHPDVYGPAADNPYCANTAIARAATGLDVPEAMAAAARALQDWPESPTPTQRRHLAALFMASGEAASAVVQWWQLPADARRAGDGLDDALVASLRKRAEAGGEDIRIAARLAARLGLQRVHAIDDHTGDRVDVEDPAAYGNGIRRAWAGGDAQRGPAIARTVALMEADDAMAVFRRVNAPAYRRMLAANDFGLALRTRSAQPHGRIYVAGWETRNLRMAANVRATFRERPDARVLVVVGAMHKAWLDDLLDRMLGVDIVDVERVLE